MPQDDDITQDFKMWITLPDPCFDPYGVISEWTEQDLVDCGGWKTPRKGSESPVSE